MIYIGNIYRLEICNIPYKTSRNFILSIAPLIWHISNRYEVLDVSGEILNKIFDKQINDIQYMNKSDSTIMSPNSYIDFKMTEEEYNDLIFKYDGLLDEIENRLKMDDKNIFINQRGITHILLARCTSFCLLEHNKVGYYEIYYTPSISYDSLSKLSGYFNVELGIVDQKIAETQIDNYGAFGFRAMGRSSVMSSFNNAPAFYYPHISNEDAARSYNQYIETLNNIIILDDILSFSESVLTIDFNDNHSLSTSNTGVVAMSPASVSSVHIGNMAINNDFIRVNSSNFSIRDVTNLRVNPPP